MSLAQITREIRLTSKIGLGVIVLGVVLFLLFQGGLFVQKTFFPTPPPPPEQKFGPISGVVFPESQTATIPEYRINTVSGTLPRFSDRIYIYELVQHEATITALKSAKDAATTVGYTNNQTSITPSIYSWQKPNSNNTLELDIITNNFKVSSDFLTNPEYETGQPVTEETGFEYITRFVETLQGNLNDIDPEKTKFQLLTLSQGVLSDSQNSTASQISRFDLYQKSVDNFEIYYPTYNESSLYFLITFISGRTDIVDASYIHNVPNLNNRSTYPIKTALEAFEDLKNGNAYIVNPSEDTIVDIIDVKLGYYLSSDPDQKYLLPVIAFYGKNDFLAYVSALKGN